MTFKDLRLFCSKLETKMHFKDIKQNSSWLLNTWQPDLSSFNQYVPINQLHDYFYVTRSNNTTKIKRLIWLCGSLSSFIASLLLILLFSLMVLIFYFTLSAFISVVFSHNWMLFSVKKIHQHTEIYQAADKLATSWWTRWSLKKPKSQIFFSTRGDQQLS